LAPLAAATLRGYDLDGGAFFQGLHGPNHAGQAPALRADLHHALGLPGDFHHAPALVDVIAGRLLDVDVLAGLAGPDRRERMPVIGRRNGDRVDVLVGEQLTHGLVLFRLGRG